LVSVEDLFHTKSSTQAAANKQWNWGLFVYISDANYPFL